MIYSLCLTRRIYLIFFFLIYLQNYLKEEMRFNIYKSTICLAWKIRKKLDKIIPTNKIYFDYVTIHSH